MKAALLTSVAVAVAACSSAEMPGDDEPAALLPDAFAVVGEPAILEGLITELSPEGWIAVEVEPGSANRRVRIDFETHLQLAEGLAGSWKDLDVGRSVRIWLRGDPQDAPAHALKVFIADVDGERVPPEAP